MLPSFAASERDQMKAGNDSLIDTLMNGMDKNMDKVGCCCWATASRPSAPPDLRTPNLPPP